MAQPVEPAFHDRERELEQLEELWRTDGAQLVTVSGRRRVGKSALLSRFAHGKRAVYLYGTRIAEPDILENLAIESAAAFGLDYLRSNPFPNWSGALDFLTEQVRTQRTLIILDEFPYLCEVTRGLDTLVQRWWDRHGQASNVMLVIAGSTLSFMSELTSYAGALHGRRTGQMSVEPFDYTNAARFFAHLEPVDRVRAYACFGGTPAYLRYWRPEWDLAEAVQSTYLRADHLLFREGEDLLRTEFHQEALYASILRAVASGERRPSDIARAAGRQGVNEIAEHLRKLQDLHYLRREVPITEWERPRSQRVQYRLNDPYLRFWFQFVSPNQSALQLGRARPVWESRISPHLDEFAARTAWEEVCTQFLGQTAMVDSGRLRFNRLGRWWDGQDEIDLVGTLDKRVTLVGECKWSSAPVDERTLLGLRRKALKLELDDEPLWVLASRSEFTPELRRRADIDNVLLFTPGEMYGRIERGARRSSLQQP
jgi:AAA+ ATPase superfamily predicted ATPase